MVMLTLKDPKFYFTSLRVENLRCFGENQTLDMTYNRGAPAQWTLILGENGVGKTTLLQCLARMRPVPRTTEDEKKPDTIQADLFSEESNEVLDSLVRYGENVTLKMNAKMSVGRGLGESRARFSKTMETSVTLQRRKGKLTGAEPDVLPEIRLEREPHLLGYGAARRMERLNLDVDELSDPLISLFDESIGLYDAEEILKDLDYARLKRTKGAAERLDRLKLALTDILPDISQKADIEIRGPSVPGSKPGRAGVHLHTPYGVVPLSHLSLGSQVALAWTVDVAWRMFKKYPDSRNPLTEPGIVLVDEIDLHLHPRWQREIRDFLIKHFPNVQFVATAHSPLMAQTALGSNLVVLKREGDHVIIESDPVVVDDWRLDQVLTSELFGLPSARPLDVERLLLERDRLLSKKKRTKKDNLKLAQLEDRLGMLPTAEKLEDQKAMEVIRRAAKILERNHRENT